VAFDPDYAKVALLLHMDGANGSTTFTDSSAAPKAQTVAGSGVALSTARSKFGGTSALFNGGYIWFGAAGDAALAPGLQDFCIEAWCYDTGGGNRRVLFGNSAAGGSGATMSVLLRTNGTFSATVTTADAVQHNISPSTPTPLNQLYHLALVRSGTALKLFLDGTEIGSATGVTGSVSAGAGRFALGSLGEYLGYGGEYGVQWMGHVDEFRYTIGSARYTANFTPPTEPFPNTATPPPQAHASAPTPLGAPAALAASIRQAWAYAASPLGAPAILAASGETFFARAAAATPLGAPHALARAVGAARVATAGPLGAGAALGQLVAVARAAASGPLGAPAAMARTMVYARASAQSPLGDPAVRANQPHVFARAQGFNSTAFGTPSFATRLQAAGFNSTAFGVPSSPVPQTAAASGFSKTYFGWPLGFQYIQPKINQVVSASPLATTQFGLPSAFIDVTVQAAGSTSGQFGTPTTKLGLGAQAIAPATSWGAPLLLLSMRAQGFGGTSFGVPHAVMVQHAASTYRATRWGLPTCTRSNTYLARSIASTSRFGRPTARKINAYQASSITSTGQFGTPACALRYRALGIHGVARFGKPLLIRSAAC